MQFSRIADLDWNYTQTGQQTLLENLALEGGGWVSTWVSVIEGTGETFLFQQVFDGEGEPIGGETLVAEGSNAGSLSSQIIQTGNGGWAHVWTLDGRTMVQYFDADGTALDTPTRLNSNPPNSDIFPGDFIVEAHPDGGIVVFWAELENDAYHFYQRAFDENGVPKGDRVEYRSHPDDVEDMELVELTISSTEFGGWLLQYVWHDGSNPADIIWIVQSIYADSDGTFQDLGLSDPAQNWWDRGERILTLGSRGSVTIQESAVFSGDTTQIGATLYQDNGSNVSLQYYPEYLEENPRVLGHALGEEFFLVSMGTTSPEPEVEEFRIQVSVFQDLGSLSNSRSFVIDDSAVVETLAATTLTPNSGLIYWMSAGPDGTYTLDALHVSDEQYVTQLDLGLTTKSDKAPQFQVHVRDNGSWTVSWMAVDGDQTVLHHAEYAADGSVILAETTYTSDAFVDVTELLGLDWLADDSFVVTWLTSDSDAVSGQTTVFQQAFNALGQPIGDLIEIIVDGTTFQAPTILALAGGGWANIWQSDDSDGTGLARDVHLLDNKNPVAHNLDAFVITGDAFEFDPLFFTFEDADGHELLKIQIVALPLLGTLMHGGVAVEVGDELSYLELGGLTWVPGDLAPGEDVASFSFVIVDDGGGATGDNTSGIAEVVFEVGALNFEGTDEADEIDGNYANNIIDALAGDDIIAPGLGTDNVTTGSGADIVMGSIEDLHEDTITDLTTEDEIQLVGASGVVAVLDPGAGYQEITLFLENYSILDASIVAPSILLTGTEPNLGIHAVFDGQDTWLRLTQIMPELREQTRVNDDWINGIANQRLLTGNGSNQFRIEMHSMEENSVFDNSLGVYEVDEDGNIVDVQLLFLSTHGVGVGDSYFPPVLTDVEDGHELGFFLVQNGGNIFSEYDPSDEFEFVGLTDGQPSISDGPLTTILWNGVETDVTVFHSYLASLNADGMTHVLSGLDANAFPEDHEVYVESINIGFEDTTNGGDGDFQDVVFQVVVEDLA